MSEAHNTYMREWKKRNREKVNAINRAVKAKNPELYKNINRVSAAKMRKSDPEKFKATGKRHRESNPSVVRARYRRWYAEKGKAYFNVWMLENRKKNPVLYMWRNAKKRAKKLGIEFLIVHSDITIPEYCPVLGIKLELGAGKGKPGLCLPMSPSVDRFDNTKGYVPGNVRVISWRANMLKRDATADEVRAILEYMEGKR